MKRRVLSSLLLLFIQIGAGVQVSYSQFGYIWNKVDTVTSGACDDFNPAIVHNSGDYVSPGLLWTVFERHTPGESQIVAKGFQRDLATWDSSVVVLSSTAAEEQQKFPDYSDIAYYTTSPHVMRMAAWQRWKENRWQLFYSSLNDSDVAWSTPELLVSDTLDNTGVQIRPFHDSVFIATWQRGKAVMALFKTPSTTSPAETLALSNLNSPSYDVLSLHGQVTLIWTSLVGNEELVVSRKLGSYPPYTRTDPETLWAAGQCHNPHLAVSYYADPAFLYEDRVSGFRQVFEYLPGSTAVNISSDTLSDNRNARAYGAPFITKSASNSRVSYSLFDATVYERYRTGDSALVFLEGWTADTVRSPGHNRNACVGSEFVITQTGGNVLVVWESNRSGMSHIYSRLVPFILGAVGEQPNQPVAFALHQNYPNPFNPRTTIEYRVASSGPVRLQVFDLLGREVSLLVNEPRQRGIYSVTFDGSRLASGAYFYRLQAGMYVETKTLLLIK